jgi:predicted Holliday junction resolvase-like endonuclease
METIIHSAIAALVWPTIIAVVLGLAAVTLFCIGYISGKKDESLSHKKSKKYTRSILGGLFSEQVAPFLSGFPEDLKASEARFVGKPIDFLIFKGMDEGNISEVVFVEVKTGNSQLTPNERKLRDVINAKQVRWVEYRVDYQISTLQEV